MTSPRHAYVIARPRRARYSRLQTIILLTVYLTIAFLVGVAGIVIYAAEVGW